MLLTHNSQQPEVHALLNMMHPLFLACRSTLHTLSSPASLLRACWSPCARCRGGRPSLPSAIIIGLY
jgi:hypothetical protein